MEYIQVSTEKAAEIIISKLSKNDTLYDKVERMFIDKGVIEDCVSFDTFCNIIEKADKPTLEKLIELI